MFDFCFYLCIIHTVNTVHTSLQVKNQTILFMKRLKAIVAILVLGVIVESPKARATNNLTTGKVKLELTTLKAQVNAPDADFYFKQGQNLANSGDIKGAIENFNQAIRINPNYAEAYVERGNARDDSGDFKGAIEDYNQALRINSNLAEAYNDRGIARAGSGDVKGAIEDFNQAIRINPNYAQAYNNRGNARVGAMRFC